MTIRSSTAALFLGPTMQVALGADSYGIGNRGGLNVSELLLYGAKFDGPSVGFWAGADRFGERLRSVRRASTDPETDAGFGISCRSWRRVKTAESRVTCMRSSASRGGHIWMAASVFSCILANVHAAEPGAAARQAARQEFLAAARLTPNAARGAQLFDTCAACHGAGRTARLLLTTSRW